MIEIRHLLRAARENLGLDVAFVSQFIEDQRLLRYVDIGTSNCNMREGEGGPRAASFCQHIVDGRLPRLIPDASAIDLATLQSPDLPVGSHVGVPVVMSDGTVFGTFCCFGHAAKPSLDERDLAMLQTFAEITAGRVEQALRAEQVQTDKERRFDAMIAAGGPEIVYQPVFMLEDMRLAGAEALSRFPQTGHGPDIWFKQATEFGRQIELELVAIENALQGFRRIWRTHRIQLGLNASAATIVDERLWRLLDGYPRDLIVIELTEHEAVQNYAALLEATQRLRRGGTKIAIDDVGAGYASMRHVLTLRPDILKLDVGLVRSVDADDLRLALISSLKHFADQFACKIVAEGVETEGELATLRQVEVQAVQGYLLGRPAALDDLRAHLPTLSKRRKPARDPIARAEPGRMTMAPTGSG